MNAHTNDVEFMQKLSGQLAAVSRVNFPEDIAEGSQFDRENPIMAAALRGRFAYLESQAVTLQRLAAGLRTVW